MRYTLTLCIVTACAIIGFSGCASTSTSDGPDDAIRIKPERATAYERDPVATTPDGSPKLRNGRTLRGTVVRIDVAPSQVFAGEMDTTVVFVSSNAVVDPDNLSKSFERIPIQDVDLIGKVAKAKTGALSDGGRDRYMYNKNGDPVNVFESFNRTERTPFLRIVPFFVTLPPGVSAKPCDTCPVPPEPPKQECDCEPLDLALSLRLPCVQREYSWFFVELRGVYAVYTDRPTATTTQGRQAFGGELAVGLRFGGAKEWGIGLAYTSPMPVFNAGNIDPVNFVDVNRQTIMLHGRYQTASAVTNFLGICLKPFVYGQIGFSIDAATRNLLSFSLSPDCNSCTQLISDLDASGQLPEVDLSIPISFGGGIGIDIPVSKSLDISFDIGLRSLSVADERSLVGFLNVPSQRRVNMFRLRAGITF